ncbi:hypothetical protein DIS24_g1573 [Lasiodiplodia hormozganensis]|uniref:Uncharacterized protein n=2 Tax=Lasiodiplodia TaxID=66739 RepID=A0A5N5DSF7_9PEZI|nr:hypothetical protein DBV05_g1330 [Lasiodiplodia theobromae]KAK0662695.1 hypothetical protein DIS24_g1573 [Lasiodiplodia hormozganensis]
MVFSHDPASRPADDPFEKKPVTDYLQDQSPSLGENDEIDWTAEEEKKLVRKLDMVVMPLLVLGFYALQLDRGNMYVLPLRSLCFSY